MQQPLVTVAVSCYNHEKYIRQCLDSILSQTYGNIELLVFDDGSSDNSISLIQQYTDKYGFFFQAQENQGLSQTLNNALKKASGEFFVPFGSDDIMMLDRIQKQVAFMLENPDFGACGGNILSIDDEGTILPKPKINPRAVQTFDDVLLNRGPGIAAPTMFFATEKLREIGGFDPQIPLEDLYIKLKLTHAGYKIGVMNDVLAYYRTHPTNTYKNLKYMLKNVLATYDRFQDSPFYDDVKYGFLNSMLLKAAKKEKKLAIEILSSIPLKKYNKKTLRGIIRLIFQSAD